MDIKRSTPLEVDNIQLWQYALQWHPRMFSHELDDFMHITQSMLMTAATQNMGPSRATFCYVSLRNQYNMSNHSNAASVKTSLHIVFYPLFPYSSDELFLKEL